MCVLYCNLQCFWRFGGENSMLLPWPPLCSQKFNAFNGQNSIEFPECTCIMNMIITLSDYAFSASSATATAGGFPLTASAFSAISQ